MLRWRIGDVSITQIVELTTASLGPHLLPRVGGRGQVHRQRHHIGAIESPQRCALDGAGHPGVHFVVTAVAVDQQHQIAHGNRHL